MMATTHGLASVAVAAAAAPALGEYVSPPLALAAAFVGGVAPDVDLLADHRKSCHYPVGFAVVFLFGAVLVVLAPSPPLVLAVVAVGAAALHAWSDVLGGSTERAPWNPTTERGVYNHALRRWHRPRRFVRYSGAPEDFALAVPFAVAAVVADATGPTVDLALVVVLAASGCYAVVRRRLGALEAALVEAAPGRFRS